MGCCPSYLSMAFINVQLFLSSPSWRSNDEEMLGAINTPRHQAIFMVCQGQPILFIFLQKLAACDSIQVKEGVLMVEASSEDCPLSNWKDAKNHFIREYSDDLPNLPKSPKSFLHCLLITLCVWIIRKATVESRNLTPRQLCFIDQTNSTTRKNTV